MTKKIWLHRVTPLVMLLCLWGTRLAGLERLPLHNDEGLHLTRAVEVWNLHPFWDISDGKIINHWPIAAFYPQNAPVFVSRVPTILVSMIGLAAGYALARRLFGNIAALLAGVMWITSPYLFFFERLAQSDAQAGALVMLTLWACYRYMRRKQRVDAVFIGLSMGLAMLFKFTAAPFGIIITPFLLPLFPRLSTGRRSTINALIILLTLAACFALPLLYVVVRGRNFFEVALNWIGGGGSGGLADNTARLIAQFTDFGPPLWSVALVIGLVLLLIPAIGGGKKGASILAALALPLAIIMVLGSEVLPRHYVVALPLALVAAGMGLGAGLERLGTLAAGLNPRLTSSVISVVLIAGFIPFALNAFSEPSALPLPEAVRTQYVTEHSAGYGLREAVLNFPNTITRREIPIVASMFPDSCRRANFYSASDLKMQCTDAPGLPFIESALAEHGAVYVLVETPPIIGLDVTTVEGATTQLLASYPRPGETDESAAVKLWLLSLADR